MTRTDSRSDLVSLLQNLVRIETENPPGNERECAAFIADWFDERGINYELIRQPYEDRPQVVASVGDPSADTPTLVFNGHMDIVPVGDPDRWDHDPYGGEIEDGYLYGRGAADMKSGLATGMVTAARLRNAIESGDLPGSILVHAAVDEEVVGPGTKTLVERGETGDYGVVLEPTGLRTATREKGHIWYIITVEGDPAHGSQPDEGRNAIEDAHHVVEALLEYDKRVRERENDLLGSAYASVTMFDAGTKVNVIPERATLALDRRFIPEEDSADVDSEIDDLLTDIAREHDVDVTWEHVDIVAEASQVPADCAIARTLLDRSQAIANVSREPWGFPATSDLRNLVNDAGMEAVTWGPGETNQAHSIDERVAIEQVEDAVEILTHAAQDMLADERTGVSDRYE
jgi:succinyl-diaminopimelate desuccinylase